MPAQSKLLKLPHFDSFEWSGRTYLDYRTLGVVERKNFVSFSTAATQRVPTELLCQDALQLSEPADFDLTLKELMGDIHPIYFASFDGVECTDAFGLHAMEDLHGQSPNWHVAARLLPGLLGSVELADLMEFLSGTTFTVAGGETVEFLSVGVAAYVGTSRGPADDRSHGLSDELTARRNANPGQRHERSLYNGKFPGFLHKVKKGGP